MPFTIALSRRDRNALLACYRQSPDPHRRLRAHVLLLLAAGYPWSTIAPVLFTSTSTINRWRHRFLAGGVDAVLGPRRPPASAWSTGCAAVILSWVTLRSPTDFGFVRSRWTCAPVVLLLREDPRRAGEGLPRALPHRPFRSLPQFFRRTIPASGISGVFCTPSQPPARACKQAAKW